MESFILLSKITFAFELPLHNNLNFIAKFLQVEKLFFSKSKNFYFLFELYPSLILKCL